MPMDPIRMYFQEASTEAFVTWRGISTAEVMVVASMAIHMNPTLFVVTANSIVKVNRLTKMRKRRTCRPSYPSARPRPGPSQAASAPTTPTHTASSVDSASARRNSPGPEVTTRPARSAPQSASAAPSEATESSAFIQPTTGRYGRTTVASRAASRGGPSRIAKVRTSVPQPIQLLDVDALEGRMDLVDEDLHHEEAHERVEEHTELDDQRDAVGAEDRKQREAVLEHQEAHHLGQRLFAADHH